MSTKARPATLEYTVFSRSDKPPRVGDTIQLGKQEYTVTGLRVRVELRAVHDDDDTFTDD
mgnify:CR=1 FL=1